ncbi:MAG: Holliday junction branch migration protein RuvA [Gammaproteobacteria bacterium]
MIGFLRGLLAVKAPPHLLLDVHGVGYEVEAPMTTFYNLPAVGEEVKLYTHLVVREDAQQLFGFASDADRLLFRLLIKISGVGPKMALTILSGLSADAFAQCIRNNDTHALVRLPGVGKKTAERLMIEMRDRLPGGEGENAAWSLPEGLSEPGYAPKQEAVSALVALGYKPQDAQRMVQNVAGDDRSCEEMIRLALQGALK